jgi:hypothetical protein
MRPALSLWILFCIGALTMNRQVKMWEGTMLPGGVRRRPSRREPELR